MPTNPTWQQVADAAKKVKTADMAGICMRGKPGWGDLFAPLTTVVQTFGGNWYDMELERHGQLPGVEGGRHLLQDDARRVR